MPRVVGRSILILLGVLGAFVTSTYAQTDAVRLGVDRDFVGLGGVMRPGSWAPIRLTLRNDAAENREVYVRWILRDYDGDEVHARRLVTLNPQRDGYVWLYSVPPMGVNERTLWTVDVVDSATGARLAAQQIGPTTLASERQSIIGVFSSAGLGLQPYEHVFTQHESKLIVRGLTMPTLPDRWYGLEAFSALVWTTEGVGPEDAAVTAQSLAALREWVKRGGHLVLVIPPVGETWTTSPLRDMLPVSRAGMRAIEGEPPKFLYDIAPPERLTIGMTAFDVADDPSVAVVQRDANGDALIVAKRYGMGRVTMVGVDLSDRRLVRLGMPAGRVRVWNTIFGWNSPVMLEDAARAQVSQGELSNPNVRPEVELAQFIPAMIGMTGRAGPALALTVVVFLLYFIVSGPVSFAYLRRRKQAHRAWPAFVIVVLAFTAVAWSGAWLMRAKSTSVAHFSVLDIDANTGEVRTNSWFSLYVPWFGRAEVAVPGEAGAPNALWAPGVLARLDEGGFLDPQTYAVDAADPSVLGAEGPSVPEGVPVRGTAKQFQMQYYGSLADGMPGVTASWVPPQGRLSLDAGTSFPRGELQHNLPGTLRDVLMVYVPPSTMANAHPWVWRIGEWAPKTVLKVDTPMAMGVRGYDWLVRRPPSYDQRRTLTNEGFLGDLLSRRPGAVLSAFGAQPDPLTVNIAEDQRTSLIEMLSFYDALPPPEYRETSMTQQAVMYQRSAGRLLDLTPLTVGGRVIVIGQLRDSPLPAPLTVDGDAVASEGHTVVRWIYDL